MDGRDSSNQKIYQSNRVKSASWTIRALGLVNTTVPVKEIRKSCFDRSEVNGVYHNKRI